MVGFDGISDKRRRLKKFRTQSVPKPAEIVVDTSAQFPYKVALAYSVLTVTRDSAVLLTLNFTFSAQAHLRLAL